MNPVAGAAVLCALAALVLLGWVLALGHAAARPYPAPPAGADALSADVEQLSADAEQLARRVADELRSSWLGVVDVDGVHVPVHIVGTPSGADWDAVRAYVRQRRAQSVT